MCGRTCLTLEPNQILCACKYRKTKNSTSGSGDSDASNTTDSKQNSEVKDELLSPEWRPEFNCGRTFEPSYNIAPTDITPVLVSTAHFNEDNTKDAQSRVVVPMMWGMIPFWHKGDYRKHGLTTNNCRLEHMLNSKLFHGPFRRGQRCVVLCEGFYEWQTTKSAKPSERAVHLIHMPQKYGVKIYDKTTWTPNELNLLKMAGLFDVWEDENGEKIYSYSVITFESSEILSWMHHRMPAILETEEQVNHWLDFKNATDEQALAALRPATQLKWYRVSNIVNNSRHKSDQCNKPIDLATKPTITTKNRTLLSWFEVRKRKEESLAKEADSDEEKDTNDEQSNNANSESDSDNPPKRPRFSDYKRAKIRNTLAPTASSIDKPEKSDGNGSQQQNNIKNVT